MTIKNKLASILHGKVAILGVGNTLKGDDGFGSLLAGRLKGKLKNFSVFDVGISPENMLGKILKTEPDTILIIDCASFNAAAGAFRLFEGAEIEDKNIFFTHNSSLGLLARFVKENSGAKAFLLGVQPKSVGLREGLTPELTRALNELENFILKSDKELCVTRSLEG